MVVGPNTKRLLQLRQNAERAMLQFMDDMDRKVELAAGKAVEAVRTGLNARLQDVFARAYATLAELMPKLEKKFYEMAKERLDSLPHLKGDAGYTPVKGKDYNDGQPGAPGYTPRPDVDYPTIARVDKQISTATTELYDKLEKEGLSAEKVKQAIEEGFAAIPAEKIARAMEALEPGKKLDYHKGLKNQPAEQATEVPKQRVLHRGGGASKQTYYYDLSDLCDGVTKTFAIPVNTRVVAVSGTDVPGGIYRPVVDWTGTGTTLLTLTAAVAAPQTGATLYILYVV